LPARLQQQQQQQEQKEEEEEQQEQKEEEKEEQQEQKEEEEEEEEDSMLLGSNSRPQGPQGLVQHQAWVSRQHKGNSGMKHTLPMTMTKHHGSRRSICCW
jgi:hypothetical protein